MADVYWVSLLPAFWNNTNNWSLTSGGPGGAPVPGSSSTVFFDSSGDGNCLIDTSVGIQDLFLMPGFRASIFQSHHPITISNDASFAGGGFTGGSANIEVKNFYLHGTDCTSTSGRLRVTGDFYFKEEALIGLAPRMNLDEIVLTSENVSDGYVVLAEAPDGTNVALNVIGGGPQNYGSDFIVNGYFLSWSGLALDGILAPGDELRVIYRDRGDVTGSVFGHNNGRVRIDASSNLMTAGGIRFYEFEINNGIVDQTGVLSLDGTCWVEKTLLLEGGYIASTTDATIHALKDTSSYDNFGRHNTGCTIQYDGTVKQWLDYSGGVLPDMVVDKSDSNHVMFSGRDPVRIDGDMIVRNGILDMNGFNAVVGQ